MNKTSKELYKETLQFFNARILQLRELEKGANTLDECVDTVYAIRESVEYLEELRKKLNSLSEDLQTAICLSLATRFKKSHATEYCTGTRKQTLVHNIPTKKRQPEKYQEVMEHLGIPQEVIDRELVRIHWPSWKDFCQSLMEAGEPVPAGVDPSKATTIFSVTVRRKKDILDDSSTDKAKEEMENYF